MDDKFFAGLHEGLLVHRLYLMAGTEVLNTSPANWKIMAMDDEFVELIDLTVQHPFPYIALPTAFSKKWTFDLPMKRAASRRHVFETHVNWFALIFQLHRTKPVNHLAQEASIRQR